MRGEIHKLAAGGADIVRVAVPEQKDTVALKEILPRVNVPIVADVHFHFQRALEAIDAGIHKIRLNPGNITDASQVKDVIQACKAKKIPIRVGVNEGSIVERRDKQKRMKELGGVFSDNKNGHFLAIMIAKLEEYLEIFHAEDFHDIVISAKSIDPVLVIDAYKEISQRFDYPLHLGVTHAGPKETGTIRSVVPLGHLLCSGIGDTIRISYANDPIYEVEDGLELLYVLGLRTAHRRRTDRLPHMRAHSGRSVQAGAGRAQTAGEGNHRADQGRSDGLRRQRPRRMRRRRHRDLRRRSQRNHLRPGRTRRQRS